MTYEEGQAAAQVLLEEQIGAPRRAYDREQDKQDEMTRDAFRRQHGVTADATTGMRRMPGQDRGVD